MSEKRILCVFPWITDFAAFDLWLRPLGLLRIATQLKNYGLKVDFINCLDRYDPYLLSFLNREKPKKEKKFGCGKFYKVEIEKPEILSSINRRYYRYGLPVEIFEKRLSSIEKPDLILLSQTMTYWYLGTKFTIDIIKKYFPDVPIMLGGIYPILMRNHAESNLNVDYIYDKSDFDGAISLILKVLKLENLKKKVYKFNDIPFVDYSFLFDRRSVILETTKGCPFRCAYCSQHKINLSYIRRDIQKVLDEIDYYKDMFNAKYFVFYDDAIAFKKEEHFLPFLKKLSKKNIKDITFHLPNGLSVREINDEVAEYLYKCNFKTIRLSLETSDPVLQLKTGGKVNNVQFENAVKSLLKAGYKSYEIETYIMVGLPEQKVEDVIRDVNYVFNVGANPMLTSYSPTPGSEFFEKYFKDRLVDPLLHNNTVFSFKSDYFDEMVVKNLRADVKKKKVILWPEAFAK